MPAVVRTIGHAADILQQAALVLLFWAIFWPNLVQPGYAPGDPLPEEHEQFVLLLLHQGFVLLAFCIQLRDPHRGPYNQFAKPHEFFDIALHFPDRWFRHIFRISRPTFIKLVGELEKNVLFDSGGHKQPRPVRYQLATFLIRYGLLGSDTLLTAMLMAIGYGSVINYCDRVTRALREAGLQWLKWGDRTMTKAWVQARTQIPGCVGFLDGSLIHLSEPPRNSFAAFFCRKKFAAFNIQAIVDHLRRFIDFDMGWAGSVVDVMVWIRSHIWLHRDEYFQPGEFVLADKGYPSSRWVLRPFTEPEVQSALPERKRRMKQFNYLLSSIRVRVEQAFGMLKGRFPSLKFFGTPNDMEDAYRAVQALMAVHNFCIDNDDHPEDIPWFDPKDPWVDAAVRLAREGLDDAEGAFADGDNDDTDEAEHVRLEGLALREFILNLTFPPE